MKDKQTDKPYHHGDLKNALLICGMELLEETGLTGFSLRAVAAKAGVSHTAPKNHFGSLRGLMTAIGAEGYRRHAAFMRDGLDDNADRPARLHAAMQGYVRFAQAYPRLFELMFAPLDVDHEDADLRAASADSYGVLQGIAEGLDWDKGDGPMGQGASELMLWSLVHGYAKLRIGGAIPCDAGLDIADIMPNFKYKPEVEIIAARTPQPHN